MIKLTEQMAQSIVDRMMNVIPYNVNIMNNEGIIIGSGDKKRIGQLHEGAVDAISRNKINLVYKDNGGAKPGVNMPIYFNKALMGVIGISGDPKEVISFASIVKATSELLIRQEYMFNERRVREQIEEEFLYQWSYLNNDYDESFLQRADVLGINLNIDRVAVIIKGKDKKNIINTIKKYIYDCEYVIRFNAEDVLIFMKYDNKLYKRVSNIYYQLNEKVKIGIGLHQEIMTKSAQQALRAIEINNKLALGHSLCKYSDVKFLDIISNNIKEQSVTSLVNKLVDTNNFELIDTLITYIVLNCDVKNVSEKLHIHRNSLNYRLKKIHEITGKNPKNAMDLLELLVACILYKLK
ncbi:CdaR family transcriptional regulator [Clostridium massiliodielmoense]|uniref:CdaR family transcriptional regulator n=1 Tax=Clostridium massiliodielmoense TaxID=1776385 RepID=UPI0001667C69|nr:sugar diacid recognition domain-containing protein [Clostridium massiliodielmoense]EDS77229.1 putative sugar diacid recognition superfamily [Clostridium botulinum C str. Eklund]KEH99417.1 sugar diacid recognition protein [Clostridium botulinum C/D str. BKT12695]NEZ48731.1 sugar diacid recognition protein [Clostridium botulinum]